MSTTYGEKLVKICRVDPEIILLKRLFKKKIKLTQAKHIARETGIPIAGYRVKNQRPFLLVLAPIRSFVCLPKPS